jgi:hypothetical protein
MTRQQLNQGQLDVLKAIYKFRFGTRDLIAASLGKQNGNPIYSRLSILEQQGFVAKRYDTSYKLHGRAAEYYLTPPGLRVLREHLKLDGLDDRAIKTSYKDKAASDQFISRALAVFSVSNHLANLYSPLQFFTKRELPAYDYFPVQPPDGFVSYKVNGEIRRYFVELFMGDMQPFIVDRRLRQFIAYYEDNEWDVTETPFPPILCICENSGVKKRLRKQIARALNRSGTSISFYMATMPDLLDSSKGQDRVWSAIDESEKLLALSSLE